MIIAMIQIEPFIRWTMHPCR